MRPLALTQVVYYYYTHVNISDSSVQVPYELVILHPSVHAASQAQQTLMP